MAAGFQRYNNVAIALHWITALVLIYMLFWGEGLIKGQPQNHVPGSNPGLHVGLGILILLLTLARVVWRLVNPPPPDLPMPRWQAIMAHAVHWGFYAVMILLPLSGFAALDRSIAGRHPEYSSLGFFGLFPSPHYSLPWFASLHDSLHVAGIALLALHVAGALKHQFIDKDNTLARMSPH